MIISEDSLDTSNLEPGMVVKNYKELCKLVGEEPQGGNAKKAQLYNWSRFFKFEKQENKNSYCIFEIYEDPIKEKRNKGKQPVYMQHIEAILLNCLKAQPNGYDSLTKKKWMNTLGMCNEFFLEPDCIEKTTEQFPGISETRAGSFYERANRLLTSIFMSSLRSLTNRKLINYTKKIVVNIGGEFHEATEQETADILGVERYVMSDIMGYENVQEVFKNKKVKEYYELVSLHVFDKFKIDWYYRKIEIIYNIDYNFEKLSAEELDMHKMELNKKIIKYITEKEREVVKYCKHLYEEGMTDYLDYDAFEKSKILIEKFININNQANAISTNTSSSENNNESEEVHKKDEDDEICEVPTDDTELNGGVRNDYDDEMKLDPDDYSDIDIMFGTPMRDD